MNNLMKKKPILLKIFRNDQGSTKASFPLNVLTVAELGTFKPSVLIPRKNLKMKMTLTNNTRNRENSTITKITKETRTFTLKKNTTIHLILVMMKSFLLVLRSLMR